MDIRTGVKALLVQLVLVGVLAVILAIALPKSFFEDWGWLSGPVAWLACAIFSWILAREKQYSGILWFLLGVLFGPIALNATAGLPDRSRRASDGSGTRKLEPEFRV